jgi:3-oxoacyl-[acyl-carrier-protein] synthase II
VSAITGIGVVTAAQLEQPAVAALLAGERLRAVALEGRLALAAARLALRDAGLAPGAGLDPDALGVVVATRYAGLQEYVELYRAGTEGERPRVNPARGPQTGLNAPAAELSIRLPAAGPNATLCNGARGALDALRYAADQLAARRADAMLVCEVDAAPAVLGGEPGGGAAAVVVLEAAGAARARGAVPRALLGTIASGSATAADDDATLACVAGAAQRLAQDVASGPLVLHAAADHAPAPGGG